MESWTTTLAHHGYLVLAIVLFVEAIGLPVPAALGLLIAGGVAAHGILQVPYVLVVALLAILAGDILMFLLGRYTGWWLLGIICRVSLNPESCILRSADSFYRRGRILLVVAKFIPGINTMAPPLAGSMNMRVAQFLWLDLAGALLYIGAFFGLGFAFSDAVNVIARGYHAMGQLLNWVVAALVAGYIGFRAWYWAKGRRSVGAVQFASPTDVARALEAGAHVYDVRSHGYFDAKAVRIRGSRRLDPNGLHQGNVQVPAEHVVFLYCTCARQATSTRVALELQEMLKEQGVPVAVIRGGLHAWVRAGLPVEAVPDEEMVTLPVFS